jgi:hypothetical protein
MEQFDLTPLRKARDINMDPGFYGSFAEIGAGQEVARYFFIAGRASQTVAKTMSAYDMTVSDSIYGHSPRYVCEERVLKMLDHEFELMVQRLDQSRGEKTRFFAFANTVATSSHAEPTVKCHGWAGVRFQTRPRGPTNDIIVHVRMKDRTRLLQQEALGILGVNLIHLAHKPPQSRAEIVEKLVNTITSGRIEVNLIRITGPDFAHVDNRLLNLEMIKQGVTEAVLFQPDGSIANPSDSLFHQAVLVQRGTFRPVTNVNMALIEKGLAQFKTYVPPNTTATVLFELTMDSLVPHGGAVQDSDFLDRADTLCALGHRVLLSRFKLFYELKSFLRAYTDRAVGIILGASSLEKLFSPAYYEHLPGGILEGFSRLFDESTRIMVFPFRGGAGLQTAATFLPGAADLAHLYNCLTSSGKITDLTGCDDLDTSIHAQDVRAMLSSGDPNWKKLVPPAVRDLIVSRKMFGIRG